MKAPILFLSILFSLFAWSGHAQFIIGMKGSFIQSKMDIPPSLTYVGYDDNGKMLNGYGTSLSLYYRINRFLQVGVEPGLVIRGYKQIRYRVLGNNPFACWDFETGFNGDCAVEPYGESSLFAKYVQAPLLLKGAVPLFNNRLSIFVKGGGGFSRLISAQNSSTNQYTQQVHDWSMISLSEADYIERNDFAWQAGAGINAKLGPGFLSLETMRFRGTKDFFSYSRSHIHSFEYSLGYQINL